MKAAVIRNYGEASSVLEYVENHVQPQEGKGEVLVRLKATSVNPIDCRIRSGYGHRVFNKKRDSEFPLVLGSDICGIVERVGPNVSEFQVGDAVFAAPDFDGRGSYGEYRVLKAADCVSKPTAWSFLEAASIPYVATTTWVALVEKAGLDADTARGKKVLVHGGSGGIGSFAVQLLKYWGAYVATTCRASKVEWVEQLGADRVINYEREDFSEVLSDFDVVLDTVGGDNEAGSLRVLKKRAKGESQPSSESHYVSLVTPVLGNIDEFGFVGGGIRSAVTLLRKKRQYKKQGIRFHWALFKSNAGALEEIRQLIESGNIKPTVDRVYALSHIVDAHHYIESGEARGKVVIEI